MYGYSRSKEQAFWLNQVISKLDCKRVNLLGVSIGGWTAMNLVRYFPKNIVTVNLLDPVFVFSFISVKIIFLGIPASVQIIPKRVRQKMLSYISGGIETNDSEPVARLIETAMRNFKVRLPTPELFKNKDLMNIDCPVLAFIAEKSTMHNVSKVIKRGKRYLKNGIIEIWPKASHAINGEFPYEINCRVLDFIGITTESKRKTS